ncbi:UNVERIFIED_CONTAM: hypothetical protein Sradi_2547700 [Sesamum radiatum]|uniref:Uncharacterized protein n=1 Tax=Sesamum radiatum TaxID=300843 RepID=A0AAW2SL73_SESRA
MDGNLSPTNLEYYEDMFKLQSYATLLSSSLVYHYGHFEDSGKDENIVKGAQVLLTVDEGRRKLNSRPFVEYKGAVPQNELQSKPKELELEASKLISKGGKVCILFFFI